MALGYLVKLATVCIGLCSRLTCIMTHAERMLNVMLIIITCRAFCVGTRGYGVPGNENDESIVCMSVLYYIV